MSREARANSSRWADNVAVWSASLIAAVGAALPFVLLLGSSVQAEGTGWKPAWQLPPVSSTAQTTDPTASAPKTAASGATVSRAPARASRAPDSGQSDQRTRSYPVKTASAEAEAPREAPVKPIPQVESVPQGQIVYDGQGGPIYADGAPVVDPNGYPSCAYPGCGPYGDCGFSLPIDPCWFNPLRGILYVEADYLMWWAKGSQTPPLVTTAALPGGTVLFGGEDLNDRMRSGIRTRLGAWLDPCQTSAIEAIYTGIGRDTQTFAASGDPTNTLVRPFFDITTGLESGSVIGGTLPGPTTVTGNIDIRSTSEFQGVDVLFRHGLFRQCGLRVDGLLGYRYLHLDDDLRIRHNVARAGALPGTQAITDSFHALNEFHGGEIGTNVEWRWCRWSFNFLTKMGFGYTRSAVVIGGSTLNDNTPPALNGGLLALSSQLGPHRENQFAVAPELGVTVGYDLTCRLRATFGYNFLYWSKVARPGDQIRLNYDPNWAPGVGQVTPPSLGQLVTDDFWAQGMNFGLEYRF